MLPKWKFLSGSSLHILLCQLLFSLSFLSLLLPLPLSTLSASSPVNYNFIWPEGTITLNQKIHAACDKFGCDGDWVNRIVQCESKGQNITGTWGHKGPFQFTQQTFNALAKEAGIPGANIWSPDAQVYAATRAIAHGKAYHWSCRNS